MMEWDTRCSCHKGGSRIRPGYLSNTWNSVTLERFLSWWVWGDSVTCKYIVQQQEFLDKKPGKTWGQCWLSTPRAVCAIPQLPRRRTPRAPNEWQLQVKRNLGSSLAPGRHEETKRRCQGIIKKTPTATFLFPDPSSHSPNYTGALLSLKDDLMVSSSSEILSSEFPLPFYSPRDMSWVPSTNVLDPIFLLPLSWDCSISFNTKSFLVWPKAFEIVFYAGTHIPSDDHSVSLHHPDFKRWCFNSCHPECWPSPCSSVLPYGLALAPSCSLEECCLCKVTEWGWELESEYVGSEFRSTLYSLSLTFFIVVLWISDELIDKEDPRHTHTEKHYAKC